MQVNALLLEINWLIFYYEPWNSVFNANKVSFLK
jgi:hypothetical protein